MAQTVTVAIADLRAVLQAVDYVNDRSLVGPVDRMGDAIVIAAREPVVDLYVDPINPEARRATLNQLHRLNA